MSDFHIYREAPLTGGAKDFAVTMTCSALAIGHFWPQICPFRISSISLHPVNLFKAVCRILYADTNVTGELELLVGHWGNFAGGDLIEVI